MVFQIGGETVKGVLQGVRCPGRAMVCWFGMAGMAVSVVGAADAPSPKLALSFRPVQKDVEYETPPESQFNRCKVQAERRGKQSGWVVLGPDGQTLRRFVDSNGDNVVDQWRYYRHGIEVYRDIDSDFNNKVDQFRWLNTGGSRWGIDRNEDGTVDEWKILSAEEASREAVRALATGDVSLLQPLLINAADLNTLGIRPALRKKVLDSVSSAAEKLKAVRSKGGASLSATQWVRFNAAQPGIIPADEGKADNDLTVYENALAITEANGKPGLVQIGEMVLVGRTWKLTQIPQPVQDNVQIAASGLLMQPEISSPAATGSISPEIQKLLTDLQKLDRNAPGPGDGPRAFALYNAQRAEILKKLVALSTTDKERNQWLRQMIDGIAAAIQTGAYSEGLQQLQTLETQIRREQPKSKLLPYVTFRRLLAEYTVRLQKATAKDRADIQKWWLQQLERFAATWPDAEDAPEAMVQLAVALEFAGKGKEARQWYNKAAAAGGNSVAAQRAAGALRRLDLPGKQLELAGKSLSGGTLRAADYRGRVLLVLFWSSWCKPCTEDLPQLKELYKRYHSAGFEILGVNLDATPEAAKTYIAQHGNSWKHIHEEGGLDSRPARRFGIISLPTMFLVDRNGKVLSRAASVEVLRQTLPALLKRN